MDIISRMLVLSNEMQSDDVFYPVITGVLHHLREVPYLTIADLADLCAVSQSTISRFARFLGCSNLQAFKLEIALAANTKESYAPQMEFSWMADAADTEDFLSRSVQHAIHSLTTQLPLCKEVAATLHSASTIAFLFSNIDPVLTLERRLCINGKKVHHIRKPTEAEPLLSSLRQNDIFIVTVSDLWELQNKLPVARRAMERGATIVLLTQHTDSLELLQPTWLFALNRDIPMLARIQEEIIFGELTRRYIELQP